MENMADELYSAAYLRLVLAILLTQYKIKGAGFFRAVFLLTEPDYSCLHGSIVPCTFLTGRPEA